MSVVNATSNPKTQGALAAGIGALIGIIAFLLLPYLNFTVTITDNQLNPPQTATGSVTAGAGFISFFTGLIWGDALLAIAILVLAALLLTRDAPFGASTTPVETQVRRASYAVIILGIVGIAYHFLFISTISNGQIAGLLQSVTYGTNDVTNNAANQLTQQHIAVSSSMTNAIGSWIYLLGMAVAAVGGVLMLRVVSPQAAVQPHSWPQYAQYSQPSQPQSQPWPQPSQPLQPSHPSQPGWPQAQSQQPQAWPQPSQPQWPQPTQQTPPQGWQPTQQAPQGWQPPQQEQKWQ